MLYLVALAKMPFSIKRLTQMHRSSSLPSKKNQPASGPSAAVVNSSQQPPGGDTDRKRDGHGHMHVTIDHSHSQSQQQQGSSSASHPQHHPAHPHPVQHNTQQPVNANSKPKMPQISNSKSIDVAEIRRLGGQITISSPIPIQPPPGSGTLPIRMSKSAPHTGPRPMLVNHTQNNIQPDMNKRKYASNGPEEKGGQPQPRRTLLIRQGNGQIAGQQHQQHQQHQHQQQHQMQQHHRPPTSQPSSEAPNIALLRSGGIRPNSAQIGESRYHC